MLGELSADCEGAGGGEVSGGGAGGGRAAEFDRARRIDVRVPGSVAVGVTICGGGSCDST